MIRSRPNWPLLTCRSLAAFQVSIEATASAPPRQSPHPLLAGDLAQASTVLVRNAEGLRQRALLDARLAAQADEEHVSAEDVRAALPCTVGTLVLWPVRLTFGRRLRGAGEVLSASCIHRDSRRDAGSAPRDVHRPHRRGRGGVHRRRQAPRPAAGPQGRALSRPFPITRRSRGRSPSCRRRPAARSAGGGGRCPPGGARSRSAPPRG